MDYPKEAVSSSFRRLSATAKYLRGEVTIKADHEMNAQVGLHIVMTGHGGIAPGPPGRIRRSGVRGNGIGIHRDFCPAWPGVIIERTGKGFSGQKVVTGSSYVTVNIDRICGMTMGLTLITTI